MGKIEEITDIITELKKNYTARNFKKLNLVVGQVMKFSYEGSPVNLKITKIEDGRYWAEHIELMPIGVGFSHYGHNIDSSEEAIRDWGVPYCTDCMRPVNEQGTQIGDKLAANRNEIELTKKTIAELEKKHKKKGKGKKDVG